MDRKNPVTPATNENDAYRPGIRIAANDTLKLSTANLSACFSDMTYEENVGGNHKPNNCFRLTSTGGANYLTGYSIELSAKNASVTWGKIEWEAFEDLTCESATRTAADLIDVCSMFEAEVDQALSKNQSWGGRHSTVVVMTDDAPAEVTTTQSDVNSHQVVTEWRVGIGAPRGDSRGEFNASSGDRFKTLWFDSDLDGKIRKAASHDTARKTGPTDLYNENEDGDNVEYIYQTLVDKDMDPIRGDFGKVDLISANDNPATAVDERTAAGNPDGKADNYAASDDAYGCTDDDGGDGCDARWEETFDVLFADGAFGCTTTRSVTISCEWDAQGELGQGRGAAANEFNAENAGNFAKCTAK